MTHILLHVRDLGMGMGMGMGMNMNMNMNLNPMNAPPPIMSREQFEAGKVDLWRKFKIERLGAR